MLTQKRIGVVSITSLSMGPMRVLCIYMYVKIKNLFSTIILDNFNDM